MKLLKKLVLFALILVLLAGGVIIYLGYTMYQDAIRTTSVADKINMIRAQDDYISIKDLPDTYKNAVIAVEDHRFKNHSGIDIIALGRAIVNNICTFSLAEGGSTITQQLAKNLYFTQEKKFTRKIAEVFVAFELEKNYSKDDILELYVNTIYFGSGYYGIHDAALGYFDKHPKELNDYQCTLLAGIPNAPSAYSLNGHSDLAEKRQKKVLNDMVEYNYITETQANEILENKI